MRTIENPALIRRNERLKMIRNWEIEHGLYKGEEEIKSKRSYTKRSRNQKPTRQSTRNKIFIQELKTYNEEEIECDKKDTVNCIKENKELVDFQLLLFCHLRIAPIKASIKAICYLFL